MEIMRSMAHELKIFGKLLRKQERCCDSYSIRKALKSARHNMENGAIELKAGQKIIISMTEVLGTTEKFSITYDQLIDDVHPGSKILWMMA